MYYKDDIDYDKLMKSQLLKQQQKEEEEKQQNVKRVFYRHMIDDDSN